MLAHLDSMDSIVLITKTIESIESKLATYWV